LLPKIELDYNFLTERPEYINSFIVDDYKGAINISLPLFLRKERGSLKLAKFKLKDAQLDVTNSEIQIKNKITALYKELESLDTQNTLMQKMVTNYNTLLIGEERKFSFGESSLFLLNNRENKLIDAKLKQNNMQNKYFTAKAKLFQSLSINPEIL